jgi:hypothetical protein
MFPACSQKTPVGQPSFIFNLFFLLKIDWDSWEYLTHIQMETPHPKGVHTYTAVCAQKTPNYPNPSNDAKKYAREDSRPRPVSGHSVPGMGARQARNGFKASQGHVVFSKRGNNPEGGSQLAHPLRDLRPAGCLTPPARLGHGWRPNRTWCPAATVAPSQGAAKERDFCIRRPSTSPYGKGSYWRRHDVRCSVRTRPRDSGGASSRRLFSCPKPNCQRGES